MFDSNSIRFTQTAMLKRNNAYEHTTNGRTQGCPTRNHATHHSSVADKKKTQRNGKVKGWVGVGFISIGRLKLSTMEK